jgi:hypothetical protein
MSWLGFEDTATGKMAFETHCSSLSALRYWGKMEDIECVAKMLGYVKSMLLSDHHVTLCLDSLLLCTMEIVYMLEHKTSFTSTCLGNMDTTTVASWN